MQPNHTLKGGGPGTQMAQGPGTQGHTKPLTLTLTLKLMPGTINLTLLGPGLGPGPGRGAWDPNGSGPWDPGAHQTPSPNPNPNPKTHAWHDKPHALVDLRRFTDERRLTRKSAQINGLTRR